MRIERFQGSNVHGHLNLDLELNNELVFLTGINGCGKTTILNSIEAFLKPRLDYLTLYKFDFLKITLSISGELIELHALGGKGTTTITCSKFPEEECVINEKIINEFLNVELDSDSNRNGIEQRLQNYILERMRENVILQYISKLPNPSVLGLDRIALSSNQVSKNSGERNKNIYHGNTFAPKPEDSLTSALKLTQGAIMESKKKVNMLNHIFRRELFSLFLEMQKESIKNINSGSTYENQINNLSDINEMLDFIVISFENFDDELKTELKPIFEYVLTQQMNLDYNKRVTYSNNASDEKEKPIPVERDNVLKIFLAVKNYTQECNKAFDNVNRFLSTTNKLFKECSKFINYDEDGILQFTLIDEFYMKGEMRALSVLSSGEKNIIVQFAYLYFSLDMNSTDVFLIDDPELSLHLSWQSILVDTLIDESGNAQLIMATHAPSIIGSRIENCIEVRSAKRLESK